MAPSTRKKKRSSRRAAPAKGPLPGARDFFASRISGKASSALAPTLMPKRGGVGFGFGGRYSNSTLRPGSAVNRPAPANPMANTLEQVINIIGMGYGGPGAPRGGGGGGGPGGGPPFVPLQQQPVPPAFGAGPPPGPEPARAPKAPEAPKAPKDPRPPPSPSGSSSSSSSDYDLGPLPRAPARAPTAAVYSLQRGVDSLQRDFQSLRGEAAERFREISEGHERMRDLPDRVRDLETRVGGVGTELKTGIEDGLARIRAESEQHLARAVDGGRAEVERGLGRLAESNREAMQGLSEANEAMWKEVFAHSDDLRDTLMAEVNKGTTEANTAASRAEAIARSAASNAASAATTAGEAQRAAADAAGRSERLQKTFDSVSGGVDALRNEVATGADSIGRMLGMLISYDKDIEEIRGKAADHGKAIRDISKGVAGTSAAFRKLEGRVEAAEREAAAAGDRTARLRREVGEGSAEMENRLRTDMGEEVGRLRGEVRGAIEQTRAEAASNLQQAGEESARRVQGMFDKSRERDDYALRQLGDAMKLRVDTLEHRAGVAEAHGGLLAKDLRRLNRAWESGQPLAQFDAVPAGRKRMKPSHRAPPPPLPGAEGVPAPALPRLAYAGQQPGNVGGAAAVAAAVRVALPADDPEDGPIDDTQTLD